MIINYNNFYLRVIARQHTGKSGSELLEGFLKSEFAELDFEFTVVEYINDSNQNWISLQTPDLFNIVISASGDCLWLVFERYEVEEQFEFNDWQGLFAAYQEARHV